MEPEVCVALAAVCSRSTRVSIVGDHLQACYLADVLSYIDRAGKLKKCRYGATVHIKESFELYACAAWADRSVGEGESVEAARISSGETHEDTRVCQRVSIVSRTTW